MNCIMSAEECVGPYQRRVMESFHRELVWVMASFLPEQNMGLAASFSVYHCPVGQSLEPSSPATIRKPLNGAPLMVTVKYTGREYNQHTVYPSESIFFRVDFQKY